MNSPESSVPSSWQQMLLAYADGELEPHQRQIVEAYVACHPAGAELLAQLEALSPSQREFWKAMTPPEPCSGKWKKVSNRIHECLPPPGPCPVRRQMIRVGAVLAASVIGAGIFLWLQVPQKPVKWKHEVAKLKVVSDPADLFPDLEPLMVAHAEDVMISEYQADGTVVLVSCDPPITEPIHLAKSNEVQRETSAPTPVVEGWEWSQLGPEDSPVIIAGKGPR